MIKNLVHDPIFLAGKSEVATKEDLQIAQDLLELYDIEEACLSLLGVPHKCKRYQTIKVRWQTTEFKIRIKTFTGWMAQIIQHEIDHCEGVLI